MQLARSRNALRRAEQSFGKLTAVTNDSERFRDEFVPCIGMIGRVGAIIDEEAQGHRTPAFGNWWKATAQDPLLKFVTNVRNAEFKRAEDRKRAQHNIRMHATVTLSASAHLRVIRDGHVDEERTASEPALNPSITPESTHAATWLFDGGTHHGQDAVALLRQHLDWLRDTIIPTAEQLTI